MLLHDFLGLKIRGTTAYFGNDVVALNVFCRRLGYGTYLSNKIAEDFSALESNFTAKRTHGGLSP